MKLSDLTHAARRLGQRLADAENSLMRLLTVTTDVRLLAARIDDKLRLAPPCPTFVYVLPPDSRPMMARACVAQPGIPSQISFEPQVDIPAGSWIVAVGPATVTSVRVGNQCQEAWSHSDGQVCRTVTPCDPGVRLTVNLKA